MDAFTKAVELLPEKYRRSVYELGAGNVEEIRLRIGQAPGIIFRGREVSLPCEAASPLDIKRTVEKATGASIHSSLHQICEGYISYSGLRIGLCGRGIIRDGVLTGFTDISSLAIRIPAAFSGDGHALCQFVSEPKFENTLIVSPPGGGKTTLLRELIRRLSTAGTRLAAVDERGELSAVDGQTDMASLGPRTDIMLGIKKYRAVMMLIRGMNPQILALDEITSREDAILMRETQSCGVGLIATAHCSSIAELEKRPVYRELLCDGLFGKAIEIGFFENERRYNCVRLRT